MRSFLRYLRYRGWSIGSLARSFRKWHVGRSRVGPKHLAPAQVRRVRNHCDRSTAGGRRIYATCFYSRGLVCGRVKSSDSTLKMSIGENARITVCGKGGKGAVAAPGGCRTSHCALSAP